MKVKDLRQRDEAELKRRLVEFKRQLMAHRFNAASGQLTDTSVFRKDRRTVARIKTLLTEKINQGRR